MALASDMRSPTAYCAKGIPDTSTTRRPSWVKTKQRPLMTCEPSGFRASGKRSSLRGLAIPRHPTLTAEKADRFGSPPSTTHPSKYAGKSRETNGLCQELWIPLIGILAAIAIPNFVKARNTAQMNMCINNLRQIEDAKQQWALENKKELTDTPTARELDKYLHTSFTTLKCPAGGVYTINAVGQEPTCSIP